MPSKKGKPFTFTVTSKSAVLQHAGETVIIPKSDRRYKEILEHIISETSTNETIWKLVKQPDHPIKVVVGDSTQLDHRNVMLHDKAVPQDLHQRFLEFKFQGLPTKPLEQFWMKLRENQNENSKLMLYKFLKHNGHPLTDDGDFIAYKKVTERFKDCQTRQFDNSIGKTVEMNRGDVDQDPKNTCSSGLHVATFDYAKNFSHGQLIEVSVNPKDVVAVPVDYDGTKMRVSKYTVLRIATKARMEALVSATAL